MDEPLDVAVHLDAGLDLPLDAERVEAALLWVLREEGVGQAELSVALVGDERIAALNSEYLGHEGPTDVISFALPAPGRGVVGDVYVGAEQARRQAEEEGIPLDAELLRLSVHGTLHVLGHDHPEDAAGRAASAMYLRQEELLARILAGETHGGSGSGRPDR